MSEDVSVKAATPKQVIEWVQLMNKIPLSENPLNGGDAEQGDVGKVHYLAGTLGGHADRTINVDLGDTLVLPMINAWEWLLENPAGEFSTLKDAARGFFDLANPQKAWLKVDLNNDSTSEEDLEFNLDLDLSGSTYYSKLNIAKEASKFYVESKRDFVFYNPDDTINNELEEGYYDAYSVGYYARIDKLPEGIHKIDFGGTVDLTDLGGPEEFEFSVSAIVTVIDPLLDYLI